MSHSRKHSFRPRLCRLEDRTAPAAGMLDPTFGVGGRVTARFPLQSDGYGRSTAIDSLGRIVVAGYTFNGSNFDFAVARYSPAGALDPSFGGTGAATFAFGLFDDYANSVAIDSLDRVIIGGWTDDGSHSVFAVARLTPAGALDTTFGGDGKQTIVFGASGDMGSAVAVDSLNRVVVAGHTFNGMNDVVAVARLTAAGALDSGFDGDGKQTIAFGTSDTYGNAVAIDSLDQVVVAGFTFDGTSSDFALVRLTGSGALDSSFDGDGRQTISFAASNDLAYGVAVDSLDRVVLAGYTDNGSNFDFAVARVTPAGALDSSFDGDGKQTIAFGTGDDFGYGVAVDSLNRLVIVGAAFNGSQNVFAVARVTTAGALDSSFDGDGRQTVAFNSNDDDAYGVAVDSTDRIVVAGQTLNGILNDIAAARLTVAGALDSSFSGDGKQTLGLTAQSGSSGNAVAVDSQGRTVIAGYADNGLDTDFAVTRYTPAGALDPSFGGTGIVTISFGTIGDSASAYSVAIDSLDRVVVAGYANINGSNADFAVARLTVAGALDSSFDGDGKQTISFGTGNDLGFGVAVDSLNRVVVAGRTVGSNSDFAVARLTVAGALDSSFDGDGRQTIAFGSTDDFGEAVAVDSLDRVIVAGTTGNGASNDFAVARLTTGGVLDNSFDGDGRQTINFGGYDVGRGVTVDSLDRVVVAGDTTIGSNVDLAVSRLTAAGALDGSFDGDGKQTIAFGSADDFGHAVAVDSLNRIVVAGSTGDGSNDDFAVARLTAGGALDAGFDGDGKQTIAFGVANDIAYGVAVTSADRILVAGYSEFDGQVFALARLTGDTTVAAAQVNDGSVQRSRVTSLTVRVSGPVTFSGKPIQAFTLVRTGGGAVTFTATVSVQYGGTVVTLSNFTGPETEFGSLRDGRFKLTAFASQISASGQPLDGDANGTPGGDFIFDDAQGLFRFFGDINGDRHVDIADFGLFSQSLFNAANYIAAFDYNGDGHIDIADFGQFAIRMFTVLP